MQNSQKISLARNLKNPVGSSKGHNLDNKARKSQAVKPRTRTLFDRACIPSTSLYTVYSDFITAKSRGWRQALINLRGYWKTLRAMKLPTRYWHSCQPAVGGINFGWIYSLRDALKFLKAGRLFLLSRRAWFSVRIP